MNTRTRLSDEDCEHLGITRDVADHVAALVDAHGPLTDEQRNRLAVLLRPGPTEHLAPGA